MPVFHHHNNALTYQDVPMRPIDEGLALLDSAGTPPTWVVFAATPALALGRIALRRTSLPDGTVWLELLRPDLCGRAQDRLQRRSLRVGDRAQGHVPHDPAGPLDDPGWVGDRTTETAHEPQIQMVSMS
jgi:hypothetical protein